MGRTWYNTEVEIEGSPLGAGVTRVTVHSDNKTIHDKIIEAVRKAEWEYFNPPEFPDHKVNKEVIKKVVQDRKDGGVRCRCGDWCYGNNTSCGPNGCYNCPA